MSKKVSDGYIYVSKAFEIKGDTPAQVAANFLDLDSTSTKAILRKNNKYFMASIKGKIPRSYEFMGVFNGDMHYRDLVRELAA